MDACTGTDVSAVVSRTCCSSVARTTVTIWVANVIPTQVCGPEPNAIHACLCPPATTPSGTS